MLRSLRLALGIDAAAHEGALAVGTPTIGILGGGHARFFPKRNRALADRMIAQGGAVLSPFPPEADARPGQFLARNGIVAALADAVVVIEAPARSGALNTATWAAGHIPVFAVPGDVDRPHVQGCLALIRDGATLARDPADVLSELRIAQPLADARKAAPADPLERAILSALERGECGIDELVTVAGENAARVLTALSLLELAEAVVRCDGARYALRTCGR